MTQVERYLDPGERFYWAGYWQRFASEVDYDSRRGLEVAKQPKKPGVALA
jgi:hypothetical protein